MELVMFSKMLKRTAGLSISAAGEWIEDLGFDGIDLTVRPGGHIAPSEAADQLPGAIDTLQGQGLSVPMITTDLTAADDEYAESIFAVAEATGVEYLKLGYWRYEGFGTLDRGLADMRENLADIRALSAEYDVTPAVHTHSGPYLSANPALFADTLLQGDPDDLALYVDPGHLVAEGSRSGWELLLDRFADYIAMVSIKDFGWFQVNEREWRSEWVPLGEGLVPWSTVAERLDTIGFDGPVSVHSEYHDLGPEALRAQTREDVRFLRHLEPFAV